MTPASSVRRGVRVVCGRCGHDLPRLGARCDDCDVATTSAPARTQLERAIVDAYRLSEERGLPFRRALRIAASSARKAAAL